MGVTLRRGVVVDVRPGYTVNVNVAMLVPVEAVSVSIGVGEEVMVGVGVIAIGEESGESGVEVGVEYLVCVAAGKAMVPFGVTVATGVFRWLSRVAYPPGAAVGFWPCNASKTILKSSASKSQPRGSTL